MYQRIRNYILDNHMIEPEMTVLAGVSGGADSMMMLSVLRRFCKECGAECRVVHVNHGIRGEEALRDQKLVEQMCRDWNIPCRVYPYSVPELAKKYKMGEEETGRLVRGHAFEEEIRHLGRKPEHIRVALAHNRQDLAETVLHNLARGTGIRGLSGILPVSGNRIRPILCLTREEIIGYLEEENIPYVQDSSNNSDLYTRNRIRHHILPAMEKQVNEQAVRHIAVTASIAAKTEAYLEERGWKLLEKCSMEEKRIWLEGDFLCAPEMEKIYAVLLGMEKLAGKRQDITAGHVERVLGLLKLPVGKKVNQPYGIVAKRTYEGICLERTDGEELQTVDRDVFGSRLLPKSGILNWGDGNFCMRVFSYTGEKIEEKKYTKWLDYDKIKNSVEIRHRRSGDRISILPSGGSKKLKDYLIDRKIPREKRDDLWLAADGSEILWVIGDRISEAYKVTDKTRKILHIQIKGGNIHE